MIRGSTPSFSFVLPSDASCYSTIDIHFVQNGNTVLSVSKESLTLNGNEVSFTMSEADSLKFSDSVPAEIQLRLVSADGTVLVSEIRKIAVRKNLLKS